MISISSGSRRSRVNTFIGDVKSRSESTAVAIKSMDRKEFLQTISIFQSLSEAQLDALSQAMTR